jgi:hypothetical protein
MTIRFRPWAPQQNQALRGDFDERAKRRLVADLVRKPQEPVRWSILIVHAKAIWLGDVDATSETEAIVEGAERFG